MCTTANDYTETLKGSDEGGQEEGKEDGGQENHTYIDVSLN